MDQFQYQQAPADQSNKITFGVVGLAMILFLAIIAWPRATPEPVIQAEVTQDQRAPLGPTPLGNKLDDTSTHRYLATLHRVKPIRSDALHEKAEAALSQGASREELAVLVLTANDRDLKKDLEHLLRADVVYIDKVLAMLQTGATALSREAPHHCKLAAYRSYQARGLERATQDITTSFAYDSRGYDWLVRFDLLLLEAIEDGRKNPKMYGRLRADDLATLQALQTQVMSGRFTSKLVRYQSLPQPSRQEALETVNLCDVFAEALTEVNRLPNETKGRVMSEIANVTEFSALNQDIFADLVDTIEAERTPAQFFPRHADSLHP